MIRFGSVRSFGKILCRDISQVRRYCCDTDDTNGKTADLAIIGLGPAGLNGAFRAVQNGMKHVVVIDRLETMGGGCINNGCICSKCLLNFSHNYHQIKSGFFASHGVITSDLKLDLDKMMTVKKNVSKKLSDYMERAFHAQGIKIIRGTARFSGCNEISVEGNDGKKKIVEADNIMIATGSEIRQFPGIEIDEKQIVSSTGAMSLKTVPKRFVAIGAGIIAVELGSVWAKLGSEVTLITTESMLGIPKMDKDIRIKFREIMEKQGLKFLMNTKVVGAKKCGDVVKYKLEDTKGENKRELECDVLMVSVGRVPYTTGLNLECLGIKTDQYGCIPVHSNYQTCVPNVFAVGDVIPGPMTAHKAQEEGMLCVDGLCGFPICLDSDNIPLVIYTHPEVASVGKTEEQLQEEGVSYRVTWVPMESNGRAHTDLDTTGCVKALICRKTNKILGTHIIGANAGEIINEATLAQQYGVTALNVSKVVHAHPTYAKIFKSAYFGR